MTQKYLMVMLGVSALALTACGKKEADAAPVPTTTSDVAITIPDAPENPVVALNAERSATYLAENAAKPGVRTLDTGLQIETTSPGNGKAPGPNDFLRFHYRGKFIDGRVFDDSHVLESPLVVPSFNAIPIPGFSEAFQQMTEGESATICVPPAMAFGEEGLPGVFEPNTTLIFDIELIEVIAESDTARRAEIEAEQERLMEEARAEANARSAEAEAQFAQMVSENLAASETFLAEVAARPGIQGTASGLRYEVVNDGGAGETPDPWDKVRVHYRGTLADGTQFDSSYDRGEPTEFFLNQVIPGWTEGVALMNVGDTFKFYIPPQLGYGERGTPGGPIGPNQALVFDVELLAIEQGTPPATE